MYFSAPIILTLISQVASHGLVTSPAATRQPGAATAAVCGQAMVDFYKADNTSYPENFQRSVRDWDGPGYDPSKCNLWMCKGYQFADNVDNVLSYDAGDTVDLEVFIRIPHLGNANVSVIDLGANQVIGDPLKVWRDGYANPAQFPNLPKDQVSFTVTMPDLGDQCVDAGACALQWHWFGQGQTYQSCIDFTQTISTLGTRGLRSS